MNRRKFVKYGLGVAAAVAISGIIGEELPKSFRQLTTHPIIQTSTSTVVPQITQDSISKLSWLASQIGNSIAQNMDIINPYGFNENTLVGDLLKSPLDYFLTCRGNIYDTSLSSGESNPEVLKQSPHLVSALRLIGQGYATEGVQKINNLNLGGALFNNYTAQHNDVKEILDRLNEGLTSNDPASIMNSAALAEYQWTGLTRDAYTSQNVVDVQSQIRDHFNILQGVVPTGDLLSKYYWHNDGYWSSFYSTVEQTLSAFTRYLNGRYSVARDLVERTVAKQDAILKLLDSSNPFIKKTSGLFTPSAIDGLNQSQADVAVLDTYLTQDPFFWSGQLDTRLTTVSKNPRMLKGFEDGWKWYGNGEYTTLQQIMRHRPITGLPVWRGPSPSDVAVDLQDLEILRKESGLDNFNIDSYSKVDPTNCLQYQCNPNELFFALKTFLSNRFDPKHTLNLDLYKKYPHFSFLTAKQEYENENHRLEGGAAILIYLQILNEHVDSISTKFGSPLVAYFGQLVTKYNVDAESPNFYVNDKIIADVPLEPERVASSDIKTLIKTAADTGLWRFNSCFIGDETFYSILGHTNDRIAKYNSLDL
jgi:hypothetical protein